MGVYFNCGVGNVQKYFEPRSGVPRLEIGVERFKNKN